jgi:HNH endonuclease
VPTELDFRFWDKVLVGDECWERDTPSEAHGYDYYYIGRKRVYAHRYAYEQWYGSIDPTLDIDHLCRNRRCIRPTHLELVTRSENVKRGERAQRTECINGHPFDDENTYYGRGRKCRKCAAERMRRYREARK